MFDVIFYRSKSGKVPIDDFINKCQKPLKAKILKQLKSLQSFGLTLANPYLKKLKDTPLWESRILGRDNTRIICAAIIQRKIVILNIFKKKTNKTPIKEISTSLERYKDLTTDI